MYEISFVADPWKSSQWETTYTSDLDSILMKHEKVYPIEALTYRSRRFKLGERGFVTVLPTIASQAELPSDTQALISHWEKFRVICNRECT